MKPLTAAPKFLILLMVGSVVYADVPVASSEFDLTLDRESYTTWRDHILPGEEELAFEKIPWLTTFKDGILAADAKQRPLLLWTMNGHPLGCT